MSKFIPDGFVMSCCFFKGSLYVTTPETPVEFFTIPYQAEYVWLQWEYAVLVQARLVDTLGYSWPFRV